MYDDTATTRDTQDQDYAARLEQQTLPTLAAKTGKPPLHLIRMITDLAPGTTAAISTAQGVNDPLAPNGLTLLHLAAGLYAHHAAAYHSTRARAYADIVAALLAAGADPMAELVHDWTRRETPAQFCHGYTPPALRERMLREAAAGRWAEDFQAPGNQTLRLVTQRHTPRREEWRARAARKVGHRKGIVEKKGAWVVVGNDGSTLARIPFTAATRVEAHVEAYVLRREYYAHRTRDMQKAAA